MMKFNRVKFFAAVLLIVLAAAVVIFNTKPVGTIVQAADEAKTYKAKCAMCHSPKAEKHFDAAKPDEVLTEIILKGKKDAKPPMPGFEAKGMKAEEAKALVTYMRELQKPSK